MGTPQGGAKATLATPQTISAFANVQTLLLALSIGRLGWLVRNPIGNTQTLYLRFSATTGNVPITDALADFALRPGDTVTDSMLGMIGYCGLIYGSFSGAVAEVPNVTAFT